MAITLVVGILTIISTVFDIPSYTAFVNNYVVRSYTLSSASAYALGMISLTRLHILRIMRKRDNWQYSFMLVFGVFFFLILGLSQEKVINNEFYNYWFQILPVQLGNMTFALICFYIASAAYRAFRMRSIEATLLLLSGCIVMLGGVSIGYAMWDGLPGVKAWIMNNLNSPVLRGLGIGVTLGSLAQAARNLFGIERGYMADS